MPQPATPADRLKSCDLALRAAVLIITIEQARHPDRRLGFAQINYGRLFIRDRWTLFAIARELGCEVSDILAPPERRDPLSTPWCDLLEAAERALACVGTSPAPVRETLRLRAGGLTWAQVAARLPGRVPFSIQEDYEEMLAGLDWEIVTTLLSWQRRGEGQRRRHRRRVPKIPLSPPPSRASSRAE